MQSVICVISIIIDAPAIAQPWLVVNLLMLTCTPKQIDLTSIFITIQLPYCVSVLLLTGQCKSAPAQYTNIVIICAPAQYTIQMSLLFDASTKSFKNTK